MKYCLKYYLFALIPAALSAQSVATTYSVDINGNRVDDGSVATAKNGQKTEISESINGRLVPKEQTETHVLSETPTEKVTETFNRKFSANGQLVSTEHMLTRERKTSGGATTTQSNVYRSDVNGAMQEVERRTTETRPQVAGGMRPAGVTATESDVSIARPTASGGFETVEQRKIVKNEDPAHSHEEQTIFQKSTSGNFVATRKIQTDSRKSGDKTDATVANYELDYQGRMALLNSENSTTVVSKDGKAVTDRNIYTANSDGSVRTGEDGQKIKEQQTIVRTPGADGSLKETVSVRRPTLADQTHLGAPMQISETVCTGKCDVPKP